MGGGAEGQPVLVQYSFTAQDADLEARFFFALHDQADGPVGKRPEPFNVQ